MRAVYSIVGGLDLAASERRCSGFSTVNVAGRAVLSSKCVYSDGEIIDSIVSSGVELIAVDAPLAEKPIFRSVDKLARRLGYPVIPPTLGPMRTLTLRAWRLAGELSSLGVKVVETHPRSALISAGVSSVEELLARLGLKSLVDLGGLSRDEVDSIVASITAYCYVVGWCLGKVEADDGVIYLVDIERRSPP